MTALNLFPSAAHTADSSEWYTPEPYVEAARGYLGGTIGLDPASCDEAQRIVRAGQYFTAEQDGLRQCWTLADSIWLNPPSPPADWWTALVVTWNDRWVSRSTGRDHRPAFRAVFCAYSIQFLQGAQSRNLGKLRMTGAASALSWSVCVPWKRVPYITTPRARIATLEAKLKAGNAEDGKLTAKQAKALRSEIADLRELPPTDFIEGPSPPGASAFVGIGGDIEDFERFFRPLGDCTHGEMARIASGRRS